MILKIDFYRNMKNRKPLTCYLPAEYFEMFGLFASLPLPKQLKITVVISFWVKRIIIGEAVREQK